MNNADLILQNILKMTERLGSPVDQQDVLDAVKEIGPDVGKLEELLSVMKTSIPDDTDTPDEPTLPEDEPVKKPTPAAATTAGKPAKSKNPAVLISCQTCGTENTEDSDYCEECGSKVEPVGKTGLRYDPKAASRFASQVPIGPSGKYREIKDLLFDLTNYCNREGIPLSGLSTESVNIAVSTEGQPLTPTV